MSPGALSREQLSEYEEQGFLVLRGLFAPEELARFHERFLAIVSEEVPPAPKMLVMRDVMVAKGAVEAATPVEAIAKIQDFHEDPVLFAGYVQHARMLEAVASLIGEDLKSIHTMLINKPPNVDGRHPLHQDLLYFPFRPSRRIVGTWTALERCTRENGCLVVVPGSHRGPLRAHGNPDWEYLNLAYFGAEVKDEEAASRVHLEMDPGDTVLFHPKLLHGSGRNRTQGFRRAVSAHYASAECRFMPGAEPVGDVRPYLLVQGREHEGCI